MERKQIVWVLVTVVAVGLLLFSCEEALSPEKVGNIAGVVTDAEDGSPIAGASITTAPGTSALTTDDSGTYFIADVEQGSYTVKATKLDYKNASVSVAVKEGEITTADITMEPEDSEPGKPTNPDPSNGASDQPTVITLFWSGPDASGSITYDVYFGNNQSPLEVVSSDQEDTSYVASNLIYNTTYYWQVVVKKDEAETYGPVWSFTTEPIPDNRIVFASDRDGVYNVYSVPSDSVNADSSVVQLTDEPSRDWWPRYSPNRERIAFSSDRTVESHIYLMDKDGTNMKKITTVPITGYHNYGIGFCWSWNGYQLFYSHDDKLYRIDDDGSDLTQISVAPAGWHYRESDCSPLGDRIVVLAIGSWMYDTRIFAMNIDGSWPYVLVENKAGALGHPSFSPDGGKVVYSYDVSGHEVESGRQLDARIFIINIDGTENTDISNPPDITEGKPAGTNDLNPAWSPDGSKIVFTNGPNDDSAPPDIWMMDTDGSNREKIVTGGTMPHWR